MSIYLIGFMGSGKSHIAKKVAEALHLDLLDVDAIIERESQKTIQQIFIKWGEARYRLMEAEVIKQWRMEGVFATGGGLVEYPLSRQNLKEKQGLVVWLNPDWDTIWKRIEGTDRPLLSGKTEEDIKALWAGRKPLYAECATLTITDTDMNTIVRKIIKAYSK